MSGEGAVVYADPSITVQHDANQNVTLTVWTNILAGESLTIKLAPHRAADLLRNLANQATYALVDAARSIAAGDCPTCLNTRMVDVEDRGRTSNAHCPDCKHAESDFPPRPRIGGGSE